MDKRDQIMQAALELFAERGYHGTPVSLIAEKAKVGSGTIYRYFKDKDDLVNTLYRHWKQVFREETVDRIDPTKALRSMFQQAWLKMVAFSLKHREAFVFMEAHHHSPYLDEASKKLSDDIKQSFLTLLREGQAQEIFKPVPPELLFSVPFGIFTEMIKTSWGNQQELTEAQILMVEEMAWQAIRR